MATKFNLKTHKMFLKESELKYDRKRITPGILHFGIGQFCRAHLFYYTHLLLEISAKEDHKYDSWGIIGVNTINSDRKLAMIDDFKKQNCLYTLSEFPSVGEPTTKVIGSMIEYIHASEQAKKVLNYLADPKIRIVSLTLTEGGYNIDETKNCFDLTNPSIQEDLLNSTEPKTTFGYIVEGLRLRHQRNVTPFTIISFDNLRHNGDIARMAVTSYAKALDPALGQWIEQNVYFPNGMVDRITPLTTAETKQKVNKMSGYHDKQPVICEDFTQWVMEDKFFTRPAWERVGLELSDNVPAFELTKLRVLNSTHIMCAFSALLLGYRTVHEAMNDADIYQLLENCLKNDVLPTLDSPMNKSAYMKKVLSRFRNPAIGDLLTRISIDGCSKIHVFWTNSIIALLKDQRDISNFAFGLACYIESLKGIDCNGKTYAVTEPKLDSDWQSLISNNNLSAPLCLNVFDPWRKVYHEELDRSFLKYRKLILTKGVRNAMPFKQ